MYRPILATLAFILSRDKKKILLVHRNKRPQDQHLGKYNGLGGKMKEGEDIFSCVKREVKEEAGIICEKVLLRGTINWTGFGRAGEDWFGFIFLIEQYKGKPYSANEEGELYWKSIAELGDLPMWEGDKYFLPLVFDKNPIPFHGYMPYKNGIPQSWSYNR